MSVPDCSRLCVKCGSPVVRKSANGPWPRYCPECRVERKRERSRDNMRRWSAEKALRDPGWAARESERKRALAKRKREDETYRAAERERAREYRAKHPDRVRQSNDAWVAAHPERRAEVFKAWQQRNKDCICWHSQKRRAVLRGLAMPPLSSVLALKDAAGGRCAYCGKGAPLALEHIVPISRGGTNAMTNLTFACKSCNSSKHNKLLAEWWTNGRSAAEAQT